MIVLTKQFVEWLMGLTLMLRCLVIAVLVHVGILGVLASIKIVAITPIRAIFDPPDGAESKSASQNSPDDPFAAYRDVDYTAPGVAGTTPPVEYKVAIAGPQTTPADTGIPEVIGVLNDAEVANVRLQGTPGGLGLPSLGGIGDAKIGIAGLTGAGSGHWTGRMGPARAINIKTRGGVVEATERAVLAALRYLKSVQLPDGSWEGDKKSKMAYTALATLAFLGHGEIPDSPEFGECVNRALTYLVNNVNPNGGIAGGNMYGQGAVTLALAEAYGMTRSAAVRVPLERSVQALIAAQAISKKPQDAGGWRYSLTADDSDLSVSAWIIMGLKSAKLAGIEVPEEVFSKASQYLWMNYDDEGGFGYNGPKRRVNMTGAGVLCQQFLGHGADPRIKKALDYLRTQKMDWNEPHGRNPIYGWYYITQAMFQGGGQYWEYWNKQFQTQLLKNQQENGSWGLTKENEHSASVIYSTALCTLQLEVFYRYLPIYQEMERGAISTGGFPGSQK